MQQSFLLAFAAMIGATIAAPKIPLRTAAGTINTRQNRPCFVIGDEELPEETANIEQDLASIIQCDTSVQTLSGVPDVSSNGLKFSTIDFSTSGMTPLEFSLNMFTTADQFGKTLADTDLELFENALNDYLATEVGIRSVGGDLSIKVPKFFLEFQTSRIKTAQGNPPQEPGQQIDHLRDKVLKNAPREDQKLLDEVTRLATVRQ
ncbi:hypothetical protein DL769_005918 [Monosporascus sp. CRB-8-3]|nr:hypothetical protein DL769_005918 [Monosporascus sp. CRB-8-3]